MLVNPEINSCDVSIELKNILDNCVALKELRFFDGELLFYTSIENRGSKPKEQDYQEQKHGLRVLELDNVLTSAEMFSHLSFRCRGLEYMELKSTSIQSVIGTSGRIPLLLLDMSYSSFKVLKLFDIRCTLSEDQLLESRFIKLILLSQLKDSRSSNEKKKCTDSSSADITHPFRNLTWFKLFHEIEDDVDTDMRLRQLPEQESRIISKYCRSSDLRESDNFLKTNTWLNGELSQDLESDIQDGYVELRCKKIARCHTS
ncbi:hypothetical protein J3Q64DRAFT_1826677 [Phycomyces blakesleeanus]|uniref:Uncharacterized protein n=2 Tax=Phycomyces blakesleeanus TaxID=4837 RepID=A0A162U142_PHYB8|nr:hypothetical protein PHYBLDRAFT_73350 [Phycomyces blakesleeanus NRRL 1555(-)]OAD72622.1 hypothetical protein PHYBLDRAFT_73350 [Phycomyces blakesleeanus NRRL 1555(-)]|eukprot:XP_018290662.1 hypothetical protein PHYBLDRAFT_73350 [Phycomyces blakesleeanus NRRL 1555(-)]